MGEQGIGETIRYGILRARSFKLTTQREVALYVSLMMTFGRNFHDDERLVWLRSVLESEGPGRSEQFVTGAEAHEGFVRDDMTLDLVKKTMDQWSEEPLPRYP